MEKKLVNASSLKPGSYVLIEDNACIVKDMQVSKPGKHGSSKVRVVAVDIITGSRREIVKPSSDTVEVPVIEKRTAQILGIEGDTILMMDMESFENLETTLTLADDSVRDKLDVNQNVMYWDVGGKYLIKQIKGE